MYPPERRDDYDRAHAAATIAGQLADLVCTLSTPARLTQTELALRMGTIQSPITRIEGGGSLPILDMLARLAQATGTPCAAHAEPYDLHTLTAVRDAPAPRAESAGRMWVSAPALLPRLWPGMGVGSGPGPGLTSESADAARAVLITICRPGPSLWHPPALPV